MTSVASVNPVPAKTPTYAVQTNDCLAFLQSLPAKSVDLIVTDPAYSGMNKHLNFGQARIVGDYSNAGEVSAIT